MPTFSAIQQLDRLFDPGTSRTTSSRKLERPNTTPLPIDDRKPSPENEKVPAMSRSQISPALYAIPEPTPIPESPTTSSFAPLSPYVVNHKRRGPRLLKGEEMVITGSNGDLVAQEEGEGEVCGSHGALMRETEEIEDFFDPQEAMSFSSVGDGEDYGAERSARSSTAMGEFFDAWEELSSDSGRQQQHSLSDVEAELREMRLSLLMEIEKRKQAEEALNSMRSQWQMLREKLGAVGLVIPGDLTALAEDNRSDVDPTEEICRQIHLARFVSESIGRGFAKAEAEAEMEAQLEVKNFEIARLCDRLHYYETVNREMSQRNQEAIEIARRERQKRRRRQKWVWGSIASAITLGSAALAWSYLHSEKGSSSTKHFEASQPDSNMQ